ncbi:MAG: hypothetical protein BWY99_01227 [Synergistetes bacterium ADurb.BinA166]|nr:MAG: hypothetical protein BWY99_01227 [Synergistetes bacterium ADurb.BinA166]
MPSFMRRDRLGSISTGGYIRLASRSRDSTICPSVMNPVRSGIGWVMSSFGMVSIGIWVTLPRPLRSTPALSYRDARSLYR